LTVNCGGSDCGNFDTAGFYETIQLQEQCPYGFVYDGYCCNSNGICESLYEVNVSPLIKNLLSRNISLATIDCGANCGNNDNSAGAITIDCGGPHCGNNDISAGLFENSSNLAYRNQNLYTTSIWDNPSALQKLINDLRAV
jgi:hypothetical protein